ncbi:MAG: CPBP family intramembrane metalloprotease, partial [Clostridia bacterium]|nr:CPBP family intramembrane metalloprotease [Clostridia bacterium]
MKRATIACTLISLCFLLSKVLFASWQAPFGDLAGAAFVTLGAVLLLWQLPPEKGFPFAFWKSGTAKCLLLFCPFFLSVWALGYITGILGGFFGLENTIDTSGSPLSLFVSQVLLAAFAEELAFRYVFLRYLAPYHKGSAVLISAATFALMHVQILQLPY